MNALTQGPSCGLLDQEFGFSRCDRLIQSEHFKRAFRKGERSKAALLELVAFQSDLDRSRLGISVPKKFVRKACLRNRIKRIVRESYRLKKTFLKAKYDFILMVRMPVSLNSTALFKESLNKIWERYSQ